MNAELRDRWNSVVHPSDSVYVLGDFAMGKRDRIPEYLSQLQGHKYLVVGNHDLKRYKESPTNVSERDLKDLYPQHLNAGWEFIWNYAMLEVDGRKVHCEHIPRSAARYAEAGIVADVFLAGHVHEAWVRNDGVENVGVDVCDYRPMTLEQLLARPQKLGESHREVL